MPTRTSWLIGLALLYVASCALPAFGRPGGHDSTPGIACLICVPFVMFYPAWWANLLFFAGWIALASGKPRRASNLGMIALPLALTIVFCVAWDSFRIGAFAWFASMGALIAAGVDLELRAFKPYRPRDLDEV